jgi:GntR family transcriptional regulator
MIEFRLDKQSYVPFYRQIVDIILSSVSAGVLLPGERLPTIRDLSVKLEVNPNTVVKAYSQLQMMGVLDTEQGSGAFIRPTTGNVLSTEDKARALEALCRDFAGRAQLQNFTLEEVLHCLQRMQTESPGTERRT